jgi:hypothetical protein
MLRRIAALTSVHRSAPISKLTVPLAAAALALGCASDLTGGHASSVRIVSSPPGDTVLVAVAQPLVVQVSAPHGTQVVFRANVVSSPNWGPISSVYFLRDATGGRLRETDTLTTDATGRASIYLRLGDVATDAVITAIVPALGDSAQAHVDIRPGAAAKVIAEPSDTAVYVGRAYTLRASLADAHGNPLPSGDLTFASDSAAVAVQADGKINGQAIGRARIVVRSGTYADTAWTSVVPTGRIAATLAGANGADNTKLVLVDLDGSGYRSFTLQPLDDPQPAWHPSGGYLVASILAAPGSPKPGRWLAALDTATGQWTPFSGTRSPLGDGAPQFSRDGQWIYCGTSVIYRLRSDGSGAAEKVGYDYDNYGTTYNHASPSPDGTRIAMTVDGTSGMHTLITPASPPLGTTPPWFQLVDPLPTGGHPRWAPVGEDVLMFGEEGMWLMQAGKNGVSDRRYLARPWANITHVTGGFAGASWSPDGKWIVARASGGFILVEVATDRVLPLAFGNKLSDPAWRPN